MQIKKYNLIILIACLLSGWPFFCTIASDCELLEGDEKKKCEKLEEKAEAYQKIVELKDKQGNVLSGQIQNINSQKAETSKNIEKLSSEISSLERDILEKEKEIKYKKEILKGLIQVDYQNNQSGIFELAFLDNNIDKVFNNSDNISLSGNKIVDLMNEIEEARKKLKEDKDKSESKKDDLENKKDDLVSLQSQKQNLLIATQGEEEKYRKLLEKVEAQKAELLDFGSASNTSDLIASVSKYDKPDKKYWNTSAYYSQRDSRWGDEKIGISTYEMKDFGCAISSVAMVYKFNGKSYTPKTVLTKANFTTDGLIYWPSGFSNSGHGNSWNYVKKKIDSELDDDKVVIIFIGKSGTKSGHYVVVHNYDSKEKDYVVHDPYFGANFYLSTSRSLVGKLKNNTSTYIDQIITF